MASEMFYLISLLKTLKVILFLNLCNLMSRYEAATIMKKMCLKELPLGEILQVLQMVINMKKWITYNYQSGWKPIKVAVAEFSPDSGLAAAT